jgi:alpha-tubulin suppressor-like RCC1 family protein
LVIFLTSPRSNYTTSDPILGTVDLDDVFITDAALVDQFVGNTLFTWGNNTYGTLGDRTVVAKSSPIQIGTSVDWKNVAGGVDNYTAAINTAGGLWNWGRNDSGALGLGDLTHRSSPVQVGVLTNWKQVAGGAFHTLGVKTDGTLWSWGYNGSGSLGQGTIVHRSSPVQVGTLTNWKQVTCGYYSSATIKMDGTLWTWGHNNFGALGQGSATTFLSSPVQVGSLTNWKLITSGLYSTSAIKTDGTLWTWGENTNGRLGLNDITHRSSPVQVGTLTNWKQVATSGRWHIAAIKTDGTLWSWGLNTNGQLGQNDIAHRSSPVQVGALTNWKLVSSGKYYTTAIKTDGTLWAWGAGGAVGDNTVVDRSSPVQVGSLTNWKTVSGGATNTIAITFKDIT